MPTLTYLDGFEAQVVSINDFGANDGEGLYDSASGAGTTATFVTGRTGGFAIRIAPSGTSSSLNKVNRGTDPAIIVVSVYVRFPSSLPGSFSLLMGPNNLSAPSIAIAFAPATNKFNLTTSTSYNSANDFGPTLSADTWYRLDYYTDVSVGGSRIAKCRVDGDAGTEGTLTGTQAATTITGWNTFSQYGQTTSFTIDLDDLIISQTLADYPLGAHKVLSVVPVSDDTTASSYGTNVMEQGTGTDLASGNQGYQYLDDWPPTNADAENDADHVTQAATGATNQVTVNFDDTAETTIWGALALAGMKADAATVCNGTSRIVYSDASTVDIYSGDPSEVSAHYRTVFLDTSKIDTDTEFNGLQGVVGLSSDAAPDPEWIALQIQYAVPVSEGTNVNIGFINQAGVIYAPSFTMGAINEDIAFINQAGQIFAIARIDTAQSNDFIDQTGTIYAIARVDQTVSPGFVDQAGVVYALARVDAEQSMAFINQAGQVFGITTTTGTTIDIPFINQAGVIQPLSSLTLGGVEVAIGFINQAGTARGLTLSLGNVNANLGFIDRTGTIYALARLDTTEPTSFINQAGVIYALTEDATVPVAFIDRTGQIFAITIDTAGGINADIGFIQQAPVLYGISLSLGGVNVDIPFIDQTGVINPPALSTAAERDLVNDFRRRYRQHVSNCKVPTHRHWPKDAQFNYIKPSDWPIAYRYDDNETVDDTAAKSDI